MSLEIGCSQGIPVSRRSSVARISRAAWRRRREERPTVSGPSPWRRQPTVARGRAAVNSPRSLQRSCSSFGKWPTTENGTRTTRRRIYVPRTTIHRTRGSSSSVTRASRRMTSGKRSRSSARSRTSGWLRIATRARIKVKPRANKS